MPDPGLIITSIRNPRVVAARKLNQRKQREDQGRFLVEGLQLLYMALDAGYPSIEAFYCEDLFTGPSSRDLLTRFEQSGAALLPVSVEVMQSLSQRDTPQGLVASFALPDSELYQLKLAPEPLVLVLDRLRDPGNVGTLLRTADAVGAGAVLLLTPGADLYDPKTVRASMGSLFNLPVIAVDDPATLFAWLERHQLRIIAADSRGQPWTAQNWQGGVALVLGNEAEGLSADLLLRIEDYVSLPIYGQAESLNVAVAGGVLMYAWAAANR